MEYSNIDPSTSLYFNPTNDGDGTSSLGEANGYGYFDWNDASLGNLGNLDFLLANNPADARGTGGGVDANKLSEWLKSKNYSLQEQQNNGYGYRRLYDNNTNKVIGTPQFYQSAPGWHENLQFQLGAMFLSPFGGAAAGGSAGGLGGSLAEGATAQAVNGAAAGAFNTGAAGGSDRDIFKNAVTGGAVQGLSPDYASYVGLDGTPYSNAFNSAVKGGVNTSLAGGNFLEGFAKGGLPSALSQLGTQMGWDMPDEGTLGGTMQDEYGENSATMGGRASESQLAANQNVGTLTQNEPTSLLDKVSKALSFSGNGEGNLAGFTPQQFGNLAQGLAGLYAANKQRRMAKDLQNQIAGRRDAYSQQMQRSLARKDAAAGRRSDYAGREVALQAALAQLDSANAPSLMNLQNAQMGGYVDMLKSGLSLGNSFGLFNNKPQVPVSYSGQLPSLDTSMPANYSLAGPQAQDYYTRGKIKLGGGN